MTREELAELLDCAPHSYATMAKRLRALGWPHQAVPGVCPRVLRSVHDAILSGKQPPAARATRPNFDALDALP